MATAVTARPPRGVRLLLVFPVALLGIGLVQLAVVRQQVVDWQTLGGAALFAVGLAIAAVWQRLPRPTPTCCPLPRRWPRSVS